MTRIVVVGNGMVGQRFVDRLVAGDALDSHTVVVFGDEPVPAYDRVALSSWFDGATSEDLRLCDVEAMTSAGIDMRLGVKVLSIDRSAKEVVASDGSTEPYDVLVLATGSKPFVPPIPGADGPDCFVYRTLEDLEAIRDRAADASHGVVVGGGLLGLEAANALLNLGVETSVVEMAERLMPQQLDDPAAVVLQSWIERRGIDVRLGYATSSIDTTPRGSLTMTRKETARDDMTAGDDVETDFVVFSAGIRPRDGLGRAAGLAIGARGGVVVDDTLVTSDPSIFAIGEVACHRGRVHGLVGPGYDMASTLASRLIDNADDVFTGADWSTKLKLLGVDVASFGTPEPGDDRVEYTDPLAGIHRRVSVRNGDVTGGVLVGDVSNYDVLHAMATGTAATANVPELVVPAGMGSAPLVELPDSALICTCNTVSRGDVRDAVAGGAHSIGDVKACTDAGTGCGGCIPGVTSLVNETLVSLGVEVSSAICEHFDLSRQQLFDLIRIRRLTSWPEVLDALGTGRGCAICRPAVGSILASLGNGYILDDGQAAVQDTNDHALANMQRNGTYSVVPRVPGGEITPAQLIALGRIAEEHGLYTKITGAQRIDLFGAQLHELPTIWAKVLDAGMESGHAYGKALRTVKSCVGSTWCRYGVQDSVAMAIELELRYRGLRAPHKLKSAVSGCTRECAEAQSKDFGVIATETGWNLYLGGNGGRVPRHGDLFATDLTSDELIQTIDRFLMFYIRTADKLQRTSTWLESLDGGVEHLRDVIVDDVLGICDELDEAMAAHVDDYACEWAETLADPERLKYFVEFVNAPDDHSTPVWITERSQRIPART